MENTSSKRKRPWKPEDMVDEFCPLSESKLTLEEYMAQVYQKHKDRKNQRKAILERENPNAISSLGSDTYISPIQKSLELKRKSNFIFWGYESPPHENSMQEPAYYGPTRFPPGSRKYEDFMRQVDMLKERRAIRIKEREAREAKREARRENRKKATRVRRMMMMQSWKLTYKFFYLSKNLKKKLC